MKAQRLIAVGSLALLVVGCAKDRPAKLATFADSASYAIGMNMGASVQMVRDQIELEQLQRGLADMAAGNETALNEADAMRVLQTFAAQVRSSGQANLTAQADSNGRIGAAYREENAKKPGVTTTADGLQYEVLTQGTGPKPTADSRVKVHYRGTLVDGSEFESSYSGEPVVFGVGEVIPGWTEALELMAVGSKYRIVLPPELAYGDGGGPGGPNSTLIFEVELLGIEK
jgi:FKBP-type peptidyl-prolyl cis-trans isomerase FkpA